MSSKPDPFRVDEDSPEWTAADFARARPIREVDPAMPKAVAASRKRGRPPTEDPKVRVGLRLAADLVQGIRASAPTHTGGSWAGPLLRCPEPGHAIAFPASFCHPRQSSGERGR